MQFHHLATGARQYYLLVEGVASAAALSQRRNKVIYRLVSNLVRSEVLREVSIG